MEPSQDSHPLDAPSTVNPATAPAPTTGTAPAPGQVLESDVDCPFHTVMGQLAQTAVLQQVLHLEGELLPRTDVVETLDGWQQLYRLVRMRVCPATRTAPLTPADLATLVDIAVPRLLPPTVPAQVQASLRRQLVACVSCSSPQQCPLGLAAPSGRS
jgi:hypothetical protein